MQRLKLFVPLILFVLLAVLLGVGLKKETDELPSALIGKPVPEFELPALDKPEQLLTQDSFKGKPYLLNVWASWCPSCKAEHAYLLKLSSLGIPIVGLNYKDKREDALTILAETGDPYLGNIADIDGKLGFDLGVYGAPETFIVDAQGVIRYKLVGVVNEDAWINKMFPIFFEL